LGNSKKAIFFQNHKDQEVTSSTNDMFPKFSFEFCFDSKRGIHKSTNKTKQAVINKLVYLSQMTWQEIKDLSHENGFEKIKTSDFNHLPNVPAKFIDDEKTVIFRLPSKIGRLIGYIEEDTFFVVWIDTKFDMYSH